MNAFVVEEATQVAEARREATRIAARMGLGDEEQGRAAIVVTELGSNILKHGVSGEMFVGASSATCEPCVDIVALDRGPGMRDVDACLADGYSTSGTQGTGLGATRRQATTFAVYSAPGLGTVVHARICKARETYRRRERNDWAVLLRPLRGEEVCGDDYAVRESGSGFHAMMADGLGHGALAANASNAATRIFRESRSTHADEIAESIHRGLTATRGAAVAVASVDHDTHRVTYCGIGNIAGALVDGTVTRRMTSCNGTAGHIAPKVRAFEYPYRQDTVMILHSDGLSANWNLDKFPGLVHREPMLIAAVLYREFGRSRDDAAIIVARLAQ